MFGMPYGILLPSFARRTLGGGAETYSQLQVAIGAGALVAALILAARSRVVGLDRWVVRSGVCFGGLLFLLSFTRQTWQAFLLLVPVGLCFLTQLASTNTLVQTICPAELRGRVMSLYTTIMLGVFPIAGLVAGAVADRIGESIVFAFGGLSVMVAAIAIGPFLRTHTGPSLERAADGVAAIP
jgi:MFS family permease